MASAPRARSKLLGPVLALLCVASCGDGCRVPTPETPAAMKKPTLRLVVMTDLGGYLEPCGCQSRPLGGIDKAAAQLRALRADGVPTALVTAGNLLYRPDEPFEVRDGGNVDGVMQRRWDAEALAGILGKLGLVAAAPGRDDLMHGIGGLLDVAKRSGVTLLGQDTFRGYEGAPRGSMVASIGSTRLGLWGLNALELGPTGDPMALGKQLTAELRAQGATVIVGLLDADARSARRLAGAVSGLDFLVQGGSDSPDAPPPERIGGTTLLHASHRGHGLLVVELTQAGKGAFADVSAWSRHAQEQVAQRQIAELSARVAEWERDPGVDRSALEAQRARLVDLRATQANADKAASTSGNTFTARFIELGPDAASDPEVRAAIDALNQRVNAHNREALANVLPKPAAPGQPSYVGAARCGQCHAPELAWWKGHPHGNAYATLERRNVQFNLSCVGCHVTGYNQPGGSTLAHVERLTNVGCESCHGPGSLHALTPRMETAGNVQREVPETVCRRCHNPEHSDLFEYATYRARLIAPGHGRPSADGKP